MYGGLMAQLYRMFINNQWVHAKSGATYEVLNPGTEEAIARVPLGS